MFEWMTKCRRLAYAYGILEAVLGLLTVFLPISIVNKMVLLFEITALIRTVFCIVILITGVFKKEKHIVTSWRILRTAKAQKESVRFAL